MPTIKCTVTRTSSLVGLLRRATLHHDVSTEESSRSQWMAGGPIKPRFLRSGSWDAPVFAFGDAT
eukprot:1745615-Pyramimonas_sp.AAC.1